MQDDNPKCFTEEEIEKMKELSKDAIRHTLREEDFKIIKENNDQ